MSSLNSGSLTVAGFGIKFLSHLTIEVKAYIEQSDEVLYLVNNPAVKDWIKQNSKSSRSLDEIYQAHILREDSYCAIANYILERVRLGNNICAVFYGHPTFIADPGILATIQAKKEGFDAQILPGISAEDCVFSDLMINPASCGCQSYEATDFLIYNRPFHTTSHLLLWQIGFIGILGHLNQYDNSKGINLLSKRLLKKYPNDHAVILYEASQYPHIKPKIKSIPLENLTKEAISPINTLYIPPHYKSKKNQKVLKILNINT